MAINIATNFNVGAAMPLDSRMVVVDTVARDALVTANKAYNGMEVYVTGASKKYRYNGSTWVEIAEGSSSSSGGTSLVVETISTTTATVTLANNTEFRCLSHDFSALTISLPATTPSENTEFMSSVIFYCGTSDTTVNLTTPDSIYFSGIDCSGGVFTPTTQGHTYNMLIWYNGESWNGRVDCDGVDSSSGSGSGYSSVTLVDNIRDNSTNGVSSNMAVTPKAVYDYVVAQSGGIYTNLNPTTSSVGGIESGTIFNNKSIGEVLDMLFYPYVKFGVGGNSVTYTEYGASVTASSVSFSITKGSKSITSLSFSVSSGSSILVTSADINTALNTINALACDDYTTITVPCTFTGDTKADSTISVSVSDGTNDDTVTIEKYKPTCPIYRGVLNSVSNITASAISDLTKVAASLSTKGTKTYSYTCNNQVPVIAYPKSYGLLGTITDPNNFNITSDFLYTEVTMSINGNSIAYYVYYLSGQTTCTNFNYKFAF